MMKKKVIIVIIVLILQTMVHFEILDTKSYAAETIAQDAFSTGDLKVEFYNSNTSNSSNTIYPNFRITNQCSSPIDLSKVKLRYYYTKDGEQSQSFFCDWSTVGKAKVTGIFMEYVKPHTDSDCYLEIGFSNGTKDLESGGSVEVKSRIAKSDWANYDQADDYSFNSTATDYVQWNYVTAYIDNTLVWGILPYELTSTPTPVPSSTSIVNPTAAKSNLKVEFYSYNTSNTSNTIYLNYRITNQDSLPIDLSKVRLRYYYTKDGEQSELFWCDWSTVGSTNVTGTVMEYVKPYTNSDCYLEIGFTSGAGKLDPGVSIEVKSRLAKSDWTNYNQSNDYSFNSTATVYVQWNYVTAYIDNTLIWGIPPDMYYATPAPTSVPTPIVTTAPQREAGAWYMFDSTITGSTTLSKDYKGNYGNAVLNSGASIAAGRNRNGLSLDGVNDYASLPSGIVSSFSNFTIATWVKLDSINDWQRIFDFGNNTSVYMYLTPKCPDQANKGLKFAITKGGGWSEQIVASGYDLPVGVWKHVAVTMFGKTAILYVDGVEVGRNSSMTLKPSDLGSTAYNYIGKSQTSADPYLDGTIDDFVIYNRALSDTELRTLAGFAQRINDSDAGIIYSSGWKYKPERVGSDYFYDVHDSDSADGEDYFEYTFNGTGINFIAPKYNGNSDAAIYIDGEYKKTMSMSDSSNYISQTVTYSILDLPPGTHTIRVVCYNKTWGVVDCIDVLQSNQAPTDIVLSNTTINENVPSGTIVGALSTVDFNSEDILTYTFVSGEGSNDNVKFAIEGNQLKILNIPDYEVQSNYRIRLRSTDAEGLYYEKAFVISVADLIEITPTPIPTPTHTPGPSATIGIGSGLRGEYYNNIDFTQIKEIRIDAEVDFDWGGGSPNAQIGADTFSVIWIGKVQPLFSEEYTFYTVSDERIKLWVDDVLLIDNSMDHTVTEDFGIIHLEAGLKYDIRIEYCEKNGDALAMLMWSSVSQEKEIIPRTQLYPPKMFTAQEHTVRTTGIGADNSFVIGDLVPLLLQMQVLWNMDNPVISVDLNVRKQDGTSSGFILKEVMSGTTINKNMFKVYVNGSIISPTGYSVWTEGTGNNRKLKIRVLRGFTQNDVLQISYIVKVTALPVVFDMGIKEYLEAKSLNNVNMRIIYEISERVDLGLVISEVYSKDSTSDSVEKQQFIADIKLEDPIMLE